MSGPGGMKVTSLNGVKVYTVSGQRSLASWLNPVKLRSLRKDEDYMRRIELLQDLQFDTASTRIKATPDGQFLIASGTYPPQVKVYELDELSLKFERHLISEIIDFQVLSDDYSKLAFLCSDRSICLHAKFGSYFSTRIPRMGRDLAYDCWSCELLVAASSSDLYRLNLEQGRFLAPLRSQSPGLNVLGRSPVHGLIAGGGEDGAIECFDLRQKGAVGRIESVRGPVNEAQEVTALRFDEREGMLLAAGNSSGQVVLYDLRSSIPVHIKDHMYGSPIVDIKWRGSVNTNSRHLITADSRVVRIWDPQSGKGLTSIEAPAGEINDVCVYPDSGLLFMALDSPRISSYFIPSLGPAPEWCSVLENLTEELEENAQTTIYDDFKFVTRRDLERLNLKNLLGTNLLRAYMHGFFIDHRLYAKAKALADPFAYEVYRHQRVQEKLDADRAARITVKKKLPKVNKELATRLLAASERRGGAAAAAAAASYDEDGETGEGSQSEGRKLSGLSVLTDDRFSALFIDEAFQVDENAAEFLALHPNSKKTAPVNEHFDLVSGDDNDSTESNVGNSSQEDKQRRESKKSGQGLSREIQRITKPKSDGLPRLYEAKDDIHAQSFRNKVSLLAKQRLPLEERVERSIGRERTSAQVQGLGGSRQISFNPGKSSSGAFTEKGRHKRSIESLGLSSDKPPSFQGRGRSRGRDMGSGRGRVGIIGRGSGRHKARDSFNHLHLSKI